MPIELTSREVALLRLQTQCLASTHYKQPDEVVGWLGAVQAQDYGGAKWAVAQRAESLDEAAMERAFAAGSILRTHLLRPTWHFVTPADIRWLLALTAPHVHAANTYYYQRFELDEAVVRHSAAVLTQALQGGHHLTRAECKAALEQAGIASRASNETEGNLRFLHLMMHAELEGLICSGAPRGKQHTFALLEERVPPARRLERDEALAELTRRYFTSHGPATLKDYCWWSGLSRVEAQTGLDMVQSQLDEAVVDGQSYWLASDPPEVPDPEMYLLPNYDEYIVGYTDRSAIFDERHIPRLDSRANPLFVNTLVIDTQIAGSWKRSYRKGHVLVQVEPFALLSAAEQAGLQQAAGRYAEYSGLALELSY